MVVKGIDFVFKSLSKDGEQIKRDIATETEAIAREIEAMAKMSAPYDLGDLRQSILAVKQTEYLWNIEAGGIKAPYAPYMEFGTGDKVDVPQELKEIAIQFIGKGIKKINLKPQPYLYPSLLRGRKQYLENLKKTLSKYGPVKSK